MRAMLPVARGPLAAPLVCVASPSLRAFPALCSAISREGRETENPDVIPQGN